MGSAVCSWVRLICVECQLIMSLLLTPYVEFFMLSLTSRLNTDKFCVNLRTEGGVKFSLGPLTIYTGPQQSQRTETSRGFKTASTSVCFSLPPLFLHGDCDV